MNVEFHIERLVLHGFKPAQHEAIASVLRVELERLLAERPMRAEAAGLRDLGRLDAGTFHVPGGAGPAAIGTGAARALHRSLQW